MLQYSFSLYSFVAITSLMFAIPATVYLLRIRPRRTTTTYLALFFTFIIASLLAVFLQPAIPAWSRPLWPAQDAFIILAGVFLVRFAYEFPAPDQRREARIATLIFLTLILLAWGMTLFYTWQFYVQHIWFRIADWYFFLMPLSIFFVTAIFLRRMVHFARQTDDRSSAAGRVRYFVRVLRKPPNRDAEAHRNFAIAVLSGMVQSLGSISGVGIFNLHQYIPSEAFITIGTLLTLSLLILTYLSFSATTTTFIAKLVGISLVLLLTISGTIGTQLLRSAREAYQRQHEAILALVIGQIRTGTLIDYPPDLILIAAYPNRDGTSAENYRVSYIAPDVTDLDEATIIAGLPSTPPIDLEPDERRYNQLASGFGVADRYDETTLWSFTNGAENYIVGFRTYRNETSNALNRRLIVQTIGGTLFMIIVLPLFYRSSLVAPLERLIAGVHTINRGQLDVSVPITTDDEIGFLTRAFNEMTASLNELNSGLERKVAERTVALEHAKQDAEQANRAKTEFLTNMSHELRTPLNAILGYSDLLRQETPSDYRLPLIYQSGKHLLMLIEDVLSFAKVEVGQVALRPAWFSLPVFVNEVAEIMRQPIEKKGLRFVVAVADDLPAFIYTDEQRLRQILLNLLGNAAKFTDSGHVTLRVIPVAATNETGTVRIEIADSGIGIAPADQQDILQPFQQTEEGRRRGGTGLGLAISQDLLALMESELTLKSDVGVGTEVAFELTVPFQQHGVLPEKSVISRRIIGITQATPSVLIVDDIESNRALLRDLLQPIGFNVYEAENGEQALEMVGEISADVIISDLIMPIMDGYALVRQLRSREATRAALLIATSASVISEEDNRALEAGFDLFFPKPLDGRKLLREIGRKLNLTYIYAEMEPPVNDDAVIVMPPVDVLAALQNAAKRGDVRALRSQLSALQTDDATLTPFLNRVAEFVNRFQVRALYEWLELQIR